MPHKKDILNLKLNYCAIGPLTIMFPSKSNTLYTFPFRFSTKAVETFQSSKAAMILCQIKPRPVSSILSWNSTGNHGNSNPGNHTGGSHSDHADSNGYPLELETEDSTAHKDMQSTATECSHAHNSGERSHAHNSGERSHAHNSGERSHTHNSGERSHAHNNGERSHAHNSGERSRAHNSGERSCAHNSGGRSHAHNSGEHSYLHNSGEPSHAHNSGIIREFALNSKAQKLLTNLKVTWRQDSFTSSFEGRGEVVLLYSIRGKLHNIQNAMEKEGTSSELKLLIF